MRYKLTLAFLIAAVTSWATVDKSVVFCAQPGTFTLNNPSSGSVGSTSVSLTWGSATNADSYEVYYKLSSSSSWIFDGVGTNSRTVTGLTAGNTYNFKVTAVHICVTCPPPCDEPITEFAYRDSNTVTETMEPPTPSTLSPTGETTSSFTARWNSATGASSYRLDVSTSSIFSSYVAGYQDLSVSGTSRSVTGLSAGTRYYYRVRATNSNGTSGSSSSRSAYTVPDAPVVNDATAIAQTSFNVSWGAVTGAESYRLDVSTLSDFSSFVSGYNNLTVSGTSRSVTGLTEGQNYHYRVRAYDSGGAHTSANSGSKSALTIPATPTVSDAGSITQVSFVASWNAVPGIDNYRLDVSTVDDFSSFIPGYNGFSTTNTSESLAGLTEATTYYFRVRSENSTGESPNSSVKSALTIPETPVSAAASSIGQTSFDANWSSVAGIDNYLLDVSIEEDFSTTLPTYTGFQTTNTTLNVTGLDPGTQHYYRVRTENSTGESGNSETQTALTIPDAPVISDASNFGETFFDANWEASVGADNYRLDVSLESDFSTVLDGYDNLLVAGTSSQVTGLDPGTNYFYRVRAENATGESGNSATHPTLTIPAFPLGTEAFTVEQTSFDYDWLDAIGATSYEIDISLAPDFSSYISGYEAKSTSGTFEQDISGLVPGETYFVRVRSVNSSGLSSSSPTDQVLMKPADPVSNEAIDVTQDSFIADWDVVIGLDNYVLDIAVDNTFTIFLNGYEGFETTETSEALTGLAPAFTYYYRVKAVNARGESDYSEVQTVLTISATPTSSAPSSVTQSSFTANWEAMTGQDSYLLDVSTTDDFSSFHPGYEAFETASTSEVLSGLASGTTYYYRVRTKNQTGESSNSETQTVLTIPAETSIENIEDESATRFKVSWIGVQGVDSYEILVSETSTFETLVAGNDPLVVSGSLTQEFVQGLLPSTVYYVKVRCLNESGASEFSNIEAGQTTDASGNKLEPEITEVNVTEDESEISFKIDGGEIAISTVSFFHKQLSESSYTEEVLSVSSDGRYAITIEDEWMDMLGMSYRIFTENQGNTQAEVSGVVSRSVDKVEVPLPGFGTTVGDYSIISIPYDLPNTRIEDLFEGILGAYDKEKWRLLQYRNGTNVDYNAGLSVQNIERGIGYWFVSSEEVTLDFGGGVAPQNSIDEPFVLNLDQGWNQIGNPYPFILNWDEVLAFNGDPTAVSRLFTFDAQNQSFGESGSLEVFGGGFVHADEAISISIPVSFSASGGRMEDQGRVAADNETGWFLPLTLSNGTVVNSVSGVGMSSTALDGKDQFDVVTLPRFLNYIELSSHRDDRQNLRFARDIVPPGEKYTWDFSLLSNEANLIEIAWNRSLVPSGHSLVLHDLDANKLINMNDVDSYMAQPGAAIRMHFVDGAVEFDNAIQLGLAYPNPTDGAVNVPFGFEAIARSSRATLDLFDAQGNHVLTKEIELDTKGLRNLTWHTMEADVKLSKGLYVYKIRSDQYALTHTGRLIIN